MTDFEMGPEWFKAGRCSMCGSKLIPTDYAEGECADCCEPIPEIEVQAVTLPANELSRKNIHDLFYVKQLNDDRTEYWANKDSCPYCGECSQGNPCDQRADDLIGQNS